VLLGGLLDWGMAMEGARREVFVVYVECLVCIVDGSFIQVCRFVPSATQVAKLSKYVVDYGAP
jgi:hypothetical protein